MTGMVTNHLWSIRKLCLHCPTSRAQRELTSGLFHDHILQAWCTCVLEPSMGFTVSRTVWKAPGSLNGEQFSCDTWVSKATAPADLGLFRDDHQWVGRTLVSHPRCSRESSSSGWHSKLSVHWANSYLLDWVLRAEVASDLAILFIPLFTSDFGDPIVVPIMIRLALLCEKCLFLNSKLHHQGAL